MQKKRTKTEIGVGSIVKAKVGEIEYNTREVRNMGTSKEVMVCVHAVVGNNKLLV